MAEMTIQEIIERVRYVMEQNGITDHLPKFEQMAAVGMHSAQMRPAGGLKGLSLLMGLPMSPPKPREKPPEKDVYSMKDVKPSQAFKKQHESGELYGNMQKAETLDMAGRIDLSQYAGLQTYAERMANHG